MGQTKDSTEPTRLGPGSHDGFVRSRYLRKELVCKFSCGKQGSKGHHILTFSSHSCVWLLVVTKGKVKVHAASLKGAQAPCAASRSSAQQFTSFWSAQGHWQVHLLSQLFGSQFRQPWLHQKWISSCSSRDGPFRWRRFVHGTLFAMSREAAHPQGQRVATALRFQYHRRKGKALMSPWNISGSYFNRAYA